MRKAFRAAPGGLPGGALALALLAGGLQALSILLPGTGGAAWWLQLLSLAMLAGLLLRALRQSEATILGGAFALTWLAGSWWWLFISMHIYGGLPAPLAVAAVIALAAVLGLYYAFAAALAWRLGMAGRERARGAARGPVQPSGRFCLAFASAWLLAELARGQWFTGFPWGGSGYAHVDGPLASLAPWVGVYGIAFVAALMAALLGCLATSLLQCKTGTGAGGQRVPTAAWPILLALAVLGLGLLWFRSLPAGDEALAPPAAGRATLSVALLQGNISQDEKFRSGTGVPLALDWYRRQLLESEAQLVVAPETALPLLPRDLPPGYLGEIAAHFRAGRQAALVGLPLGDDREGYTNSVLGLQPGADAYRYDKYHLVPFGEFIPPLFRWFTDLMQIPLGDFKRGALAPPSFDWQGQRLAPNICYEDLFGEELAARFADPAGPPTAFVNVSNIAWFGDSSAIGQHLQISRMRALEMRRPVIRATNTGATVLIDHLGRVRGQLAPRTRGVLTGEIEGRGGRTAYARWAGVWGLAPLWGLGLALLAATTLGRRQKEAGTGS